MQSSSSPSSSLKCSDPWSNSIGLGSSQNHGEDEPFRDSGIEHGPGDDDDDDVTTELREIDDETGRERIYNNDDTERDTIDASESDGVKEQSDKEDFIPINQVMDDGKEGEGEEEEGARFHDANQLKLIQVEAQTSEDTHDQKLPINEDPLLRVLSDSTS